MKHPPALIPIYDPISNSITDGASVTCTRFCLEKITSNDQNCISHYSSMPSSGELFKECPYGFTSLTTTYRGINYVATGVVAAPRFESNKQSEKAKSNPANRVSRSSMLETRDLFRSTSMQIEEALDSSRKNLPQALHELRKLNKVIKDAIDREIEESPKSNHLRAIEGASQIMSNIFEFIEALANPEALIHLKMDESIALFDLSFKAKKIYQHRAKLKPININVEGDENTFIYGSKKSFPIVLTVLIENAIKYGRRDTTIDIKVVNLGPLSSITISNRTDGRINPDTCFEKGIRFYPGNDSEEISDESGGLGLYIAKKVIRAHGGEINCTQQGDLVTFTATAPSYVVRSNRERR
jgi:signal transduction histidine kinase